MTVSKTPMREVDASVPHGRNHQVIQVLAPEDTTCTAVAIGASNASAAVPTGADIVEIGVSANCYFGFGDSGVDVSSGTWRFLPPGVYVYRVPSGATHYAAIGYAGATGVLTCGRLH